MVATSPSVSQLVSSGGAPDDLPRFDLPAGYPPADCPPPAASPPVGGELAHLLELIRRSGQPLVAQWLAHLYASRVYRAAQEYYAAVRAADARQAAVNAAHEAANALLDAALVPAKKAAEAARARLAPAWATLNAAAAAAGVAEDLGTPARLLAALLAGPSPAELAGQAGLDYPPTPHPEPDLLALLAPLALGPLLGLCLGVVIGIITSDDLAKGDRWGTLGPLAGLGIVIVAILGSLAEKVAALFARARTSGDQGPLAAPAGAGLVLRVVCAAAFIAVVLAEIGLEGLSLRLLLLQAEIAASRLSGVPPAPVPLVLPLLIGCMITLPFVLRKFMGAFQHCQQDQLARQVAGRLAAAERAARDQRLAPPEMRKAVAAAYEVQRCHADAERCAAEVSTLEARRATPLTEHLPHDAERIRQARRVAMREARRFYRLLAWVVRALEPVRRQRRWGRRPPPSAPPVSGNGEGTLPESLRAELAKLAPLGAGEG